MCIVCCKEFGGWCKSFTKVERALAILEAMLLIVFIAFLIFLILHFLACSQPDTSYVFVYPTTKQSVANYQTTSKYLKPIGKHTIPAGKYSTPTKKLTKANIECSWTPSVKTTAETHYYEDGTIRYHSAPSSSTKVESRKTTFNSFDDTISNTDSSTKYVNSKENVEYFDEDFENSDETDGEDAGDIYKKYALALVKLKPHQDVIFGCILTLITKHWTLTAASCIESIKEVDSLDSFVIMKDYGSPRKGKVYPVVDVQVHPFYEGSNRSYDLAALKSENSLAPGAGRGVDLPSMIDYLLLTIGERLIVLGYGPFRTIEKGPSGRSLRKVYVYSLPPRQCRVDAWSLRHLAAGGAVAQAPCGGAALCAGALFARGAPCGCGAGAPLLSGATLLGVMADGRRCGVACEPQIYVNIAAVRDWVDSVIDS